MSDIRADFTFNNYRILNLSLTTDFKEDRETYFDFTTKYFIDEEQHECMVGIDFEVSELNTKVVGEIVGNFSFSDVIPRKDYEQYGLSNGLAILFPYIRSAVSNLSLQTNGEILMIPTINIVEYMKTRFSQQKDDNNEKNNPESN